MTERQLTIDFARGEQLAILRDAVLPVSRGKDGRGVSPHILKGVLRSIDDYGRGRECYPSLATIAEGANISHRQARRAVEALVSELSVLIVERRAIAGRMTGNHYRIVWSDLALLCPSRRPNQVATGKDQVATRAHQVATSVDQVATSGHLSVLSAYEAPPPNPLNFQTTLETEWEAAAELLREIGLTLADHTVDLARRRGLTPEDVLEIAATYSANRGRLDGPGAIRFRIEMGQWPAENVLAPEVVQSRDAAAEAIRDERRARIAAEQDGDAQRRAELLELERAHGEAFERLTAGELRALIDRTWSECPATRQSVRRAIAAGERLGWWYRLGLLRRFREECSGSGIGK